MVFLLNLVPSFYNYFHLLNPVATSKLMLWLLGPPPLVSVLVFGYHVFLEFFTNLVGPPPPAFSSGLLPPLHNGPVITSGPITYIPSFIFNIWKGMRLFAISTPPLLLIFLTTSTQCTHIGGVGKLFLHVNEMDASALQRLQKESITVAGGSKTLEKKIWLPTTQNLRLKIGSN